MLTVFLRAIVLYSVTLITLRAMGKHQLGQFQPYEFALALLIADLMATPMGDVSTPLLHGVLPVAALFIVHCLLTFLSMRFDKFRAFLSGKPCIVISKGVIDKKELTRLCLSLSDLLEGMRESGILDPAEVGTAIIEADGHICAFPESKDRPLTPRDMQIDTPYEGMPLPIIMDGRIQQANLSMTKKDETWVNSLLTLYNLRPKDVLLMSLNTQGQVQLQDMRGARLSFEAMKPQEVSW